VEEKEADRRLKGLAESGLFRRIDVPKVGSYFTLPKGMKAPRLTLEQVSLSHVTERAKVTEPVELEAVVKTAVKNLYTEVAQKPRGVFHFPVGREGAKLAGYPDKVLDRIPKEAVESFAGVG